MIYTMIFQVHIVFQHVTEFLERVNAKEETPDVGKFLVLHLKYQFPYLSSGLLQ